MLEFRNTENYEFVEVNKQQMIGSTSSKEMTVIEKYPEYGFKPTSQIKINKMRVIIVIILGAIISIVGLIWLFSSFGEEVNNSFSNIWPKNICMIVGLVLFVMGLIMYINKVWLIVEKADYISQNSKCGTRGEYCIFVKNNKFGVYKPFYSKVVIPAIYDKLTWHTWKQLIAEKGGETILININGKRLS